MEATNEKETASQATEKPQKRLPKTLRTTLKALAWTIGGLLALVALILCLVVWILTPERLTPIVEDIANEYVTDAKISIGSIELTVWKTFPYASVEVTDLSVISHALKGESIPDFADSLLLTHRLRAEVNIAKIPTMVFDIKEIIIDKPYINLVALNDSTANYLITPPSKPDTTKSEVTILPEVIVRKFTVTSNKGIRYADLTNKIGVTLNTDSVSLTYNEKSKTYDLDFEGNVFAEIPDYKVCQAIPFSFIGNINWNTSNPYNCKLNDFHAEVAKIPVVINTDISLGDTLTVKALKLGIGPIKYADMTEQIPAAYLNGLERVKTDLAVSANFTLDKPYRLEVDIQPSFHADISIPECYVQPGKYDAYRINKFNVDAKLSYNGNNPDKSVVELKNILLDGFGINISASGTATNLFKDPNVDGKVFGELNFGRILKLIPQELPLALTGNMDLNTTFKFALSNLNVNNFQKIQVNGEVNFNDVTCSIPIDSTFAYVERAKVKFGTDASFVNKDNQLKKLLMASVAIDSASASMPGLDLTLCNASIGAGSVGSASDLLDTTQITPIGARFRIGKLNFLSSADSVRLRLRDLESNGSIRRNHTPNGKPKFDFGINVERIRFADKTSSLNLRKGNIKLSAQARIRKQNARIQAKIDSLSRIYPELSRDSVMAIYRAQRRSRVTTTDDEEYLDLSVDNKLKKLFRNWDIFGSLTARRGSLFTPYFPLRNVVRNVDMDFNLDTFAIRNIDYKEGNNDLKVKGEVRNIRSTLLGSKRKALTVDFDLISDSLDVNQVIAALYKGQAFSDDTVAAAKFNIAAVDDDNEEQMQTAVDNIETDTTTHKAIIVPKNVAVDLKLRNKYTRYADMNITDITSDLMINNGVLSIRNLSGKAYDGMLRLDLVYASADKSDIGAGMFLQLDSIQVGKFLNLMPAVDSIMPMLKGVDGVINAKLIASTKVDSLMNIIMPTTNAALQIDGKNLVLLDTETFRTISKMLMFKNKQRNLIDSLSVEVAAYDSNIDVYPFVLNMDRYRLAMAGYNDFDLNFNYHTSVLKSPLPFKIGINISGNPDKMKFRLGKAKLKEKEVARKSLITDTTKVNLFRQMNAIMRRGAQAALENSDVDLYNAKEKQNLRRQRKDFGNDGETFTHQDSIAMIKEGLIAAPDTPLASQTKQAQGKGKRKGKKTNTSTAVKPKND